MAEDPQKQGAPDPEPYVVGPGRPPLETRFKPGVSGNPGGRKKGASLTAPIMRLLAAERNEHGEGRRAVEMAQRILDVASGRSEATPEELRAALALWERADGKVLQEIAADVRQHTTRVVVEMPKDG